MSSYLLQEKNEISGHIPIKNILLMQQESAVNNKRIAKNTILLYFRMLFLMVITLYTSRVILQVLGVVDFGIYNVVGGIVVLFTFISGPLADATRRFMTFELGKNNIDALKKVFSTSIYIHVLFSLIILFLSETIGLWFLYTQLNIPPERFNAALYVYQYSVLATIVTILQTPYTAAIIAHEEMQPFAYISIVEALLKLFTVFLLVGISYDKLVIYAFLFLLVQLMILVSYYVYCIFHYKESKIILTWDRALVKEMSSFIGWTMTGGVETMLNGQGINMLLNIFYGPAINASRGIALQMQGTLIKFCSNFQTAINPQLTKSYAIGDLESMHQLIILSSKFSYYLLYILSLPVVFATDYILGLWLGIVPEHTSNFFRLVIVVSLMSVLSNSMVASIHATGRLKTFQIVVEAINILVLPLSYVLLKIHLWAPELVYIVYALLSIVAQIVRVYIVLPKINLSFNTYIKEIVVPLIRVTFVSLILPIILVNLLTSKPWEELLIIVVTLLSVVVSIYILGLTNTEKMVVKKYYKSAIKWKRK